MAVSSAYNISQLGPNLRLDASYYQPQYFDNRRLLQRLSWPLVRLGNVAYITNGQTPRKADLSVGDVLFLTAESVHDLHIDYASAKRILSEHHTGELKRTILRENDVLVTIKGRAGNAAVVMEPPGEVNINQDVARVVLQRRDLSPFYVSAFIVSKYGRLQAEQLITDQINPFLGLGNLQRIQIPVMPLSFQKQIEAIVRQAHTTSVRSQALYRQAEQLLLDELGLHDLNLPDRLHSQAVLTQAWEAHRIDSEYFRPRCLGATEAIYNCGHPVYPLQEFLTAPLTNGATPLGADYAGGEVVFLTAENIKELQVWPDDKRIAAEFSNSVLARSRLKPGDLLITIKGKVGMAAVVPEFEGEWNINQDVARAQIDPSVNPYYLAVFFESELGQAQVDRLTTGAINPFLGLGNLIDFPIPIPPRDVQDRFEGITREIIEKRRQAEALLEQAKRKVEAMIESEVAHG